MRIESLLVPAGGGLKVKSGSGTFTDSLKEGDVVRAQVLSSGKNAVVLKTEDGQIFKARLDTNVILSQGDKVILEVAGKENGIVSLSIRGEETASGGASGRSWPGVDLDDKSLEPYAYKLSELRLPVTEQAARLMRELIVQNPGMSLDEAAFIVSNKLTGDADLIKAAIALLSDGEKTDAMIARLLALLLTSESVGTGNQEPGTGITVANDFQTPETSAPALIPNTAPPADPLTGNPAPGVQNPEFSASPLMDMIRLISGAASGLTDAFSGGETVSSPMAKPIITQSDNIMQNTNVENIQDFSYKYDENGEKSTLHTQDTVISSFQSIQTPEFPGETGRLGTYPEAGVSTLISAPLTAEELPSADTTSGIQYPGSTAAGRALADILSGLPEFSGTPAPALQRFSNMLLRIADDSSDIGKGDTEKLKQLLDKLFTRIEKSGEETGERLRSAREELYARLAFIEEAVSRASPPARTEMLEQTGKLMDHIRLLNNIDQFAYLQLPVMIGQERKTAELYVFKRKGSKRPDPDNVNILLALDLENMGRWESLMNFRNKDVSIRMEVSGEAEKAFFSNNTVLLHEMLAEAGFKLTSVNILYSGEETTPLSALAFFEEYTGHRAGKINFVI